jgi:hypothetical protein
MNIRNTSEALKALLAKVEAGDIPDTGVDRFRAIPKRGGGVYADPNWYNAHGAYWRGDLNAAKALHEAVLPGWGWYASDIGEVKVYGGSDGPFYEGDATNPARAWLIAILKALISEEKTHDYTK